MVRIKAPVLPFAVFLTLVLCVSQVVALGLSGPPLEIVFRPGYEESAAFSVIGANHPVVVEVSGELAEYVTLSEVIGNKFTLHIKLPEYLEPGERYFYIAVSEKGEGSAGASALLGIRKGIKVEVLAYTKSIAAEWKIPNVNEGTPIDIRLVVSSRGYPGIDNIKGIVNIYDKSNVSLATLHTTEASLPGLSRKTLEARFDTVGLPVAEYRAEAIVYYDGEIYDVNPATFRIGNIDLELLSYTEELGRGFSEFSANVKNNWGNELKDVYANVLLEDNQLLKTPTISLGPWADGEIGGIMKVDWPLGEYSGSVQLFYEGESKEIPITFTIIEADEDSSIEVEEQESGLKDGLFSTEVIIFVVVLVILFIVGILIIFKNRSRNNGDKDDF